MGKAEPTDDKRCGTPAGYKAHMRRGERACQLCRAAHSKLRREGRAAAKAGAGKASVKPKKPAATNQEEKGSADGGAPRYLGREGRALWDAANAAYEFNAPARVVLAEVCRTTDRLDRIAGALSSKSNLWFEIKDSPEVEMEEMPEFSVSVNGMIGEARQLLGALRTALNQLGINEVQAAASGEEQVSVLDQLRARREARREAGA